MDLLGPFDFIRRQRLIETRSQMIAHHSAFLTQAMKNPQDYPPIPRIRVDEGGYDELMQQPGARAAAQRWWASALKPTVTNTR